MTRPSQGFLCLEKILKNLNINFFFFFGEIIKEGYLGLNRTVFGGLYWTGFRRPRLSACTGLCGPG